MKECNKCDTTPQSLSPSAFSRAAASVTLHFSPLPLHSVTLRVTLPEPCESFSNTGLTLPCYTVTRKIQIHRSNRSSSLHTTRRVSDSLPPCCLASSSCECVPVLGTFEPRCAAFAGKFPASHPGKTQRSGFGGTRRKRGVNELSRSRGSKRYGAAFDVSQHRICLYVGPWPPHRQMPPRAVPAPVYGALPQTP